MNDKRKTTVSKYLAKHLRHEPEALGLTLAPGGWVPIDELLEATGRHGFPITRTELDEVVQKSGKQRFAFDETGTLIRANQGHSTDVDLQLELAPPPDILYHGTARQNVAAITLDGLKKMARHHVHLSKDVDTAKKVGMRHGVPVILLVDAEGMCRDGFLFYMSANGVWLTDSVPPEYLSLQSKAPTPTKSLSLSIRRFSSTRAARWLLQSSAIRSPFRLCAPIPPTCNSDCAMT